MHAQNYATEDTYVCVENDIDVILPATRRHYGTQQNKQGMVIKRQVCMLYPFLILSLLSLLIHIAAREATKCGCLFLIFPLLFTHSHSLTQAATSIPFSFAAFQIKCFCGWVV